MKKILFISLLILASYMQAQVSFGKPEKTNDNWKFSLDNPADASSVNVDDSQWRQVDLPHDWSVKGQLGPSLASCTGFLPGGSGWYRKNMPIPETKKQRKYIFTSKACISAAKYISTASYWANVLTGIIYWDIPYQAEKLEVTGLDKSDNIISRYNIQSSKRPYAIQVIDKNVGFDKANGIAQIVLQIIDEDGAPVILADNEITCHIAGKAKLLGLEGGNNQDMGDYTDNRQRVYHGKLLAYIQVREANSAVKIIFSSALLQSDEVTIDAK